MNKRDLHAKMLIILSLGLMLSACGNQTSESGNNTTQVSENIAVESDLGGIDYSKSYDEVLSKYRDFANDYISGIAESSDKYSEEPWFNLMTMSVKEGGFGYALKDLNGNGIPELLLITKDKYFEDNDYVINAIYSLVGNNPKLLDSFWYGYRCYLAKDGFIYMQGSNNAWESVYEKSKIKSDDSVIEIIETIETDSFDEITQERLKDDKGEVITKYYYSKGSEKRNEISEQKFQEIRNQWPSDNKNCGLEFIPLIET